MQSLNYARPFFFLMFTYFNLFSYRTGSFKPTVAQRSTLCGKSPLELKKFFKYLEIEFSIRICRCENETLCSLIVYSTRIYMYIYIYVHIHIHMYTYLHIYIRAQAIYDVRIVQLSTKPFNMKSGERSILVYCL